MAAKDAAQKDKESQKEQIYYSDTYKDVRGRERDFFAERWNVRVLSGNVRISPCDSTEGDRQESAERSITNRT